MSDGPTGVKAQSQSGGRPTSLLPNATVLASSWSEEMLAEVGAFLGGEAEQHHTHVVLGPTINLHRSPLGGRLFECYSEDPLLTGRLAAAYVRGLQDHGVAACLKHLVANEAETERHTVDVRLDEATLREVYLLPFEIAVTDADAWLLMAAYNRVNGVPATEHSAVINDIVKGEWGYPGLVVSDFFATHSTAAAINGGLDVVLPGPFGPWGERLVAAVERGEVAEARVDDAVRRLLRLADRVGGLDAPSGEAGDPCPDRSRLPSSPAALGRRRHDRADERRHAAAADRRPDCAHRRAGPRDPAHGRRLGRGHSAAPGIGPGRAPRGSRRTRDLRRRRRAGLHATSGPTGFRRRSCRRSARCAAADHRRRR